jgi:L-serine deaminase
MSIAQLAMANEVAVSGKSEAEINAFLDKISTAMVNIVKSGLAAPPAVLPAVVYALGEGGRKLPHEKIREGLLAGAVIGYLGKYNATLAGAEGGCQAEIGVASSMAAALIAQAHDFDHQVWPTPPSRRSSITSVSRATRWRASFRCRASSAAPTGRSRPGPVS